MGLDMYWFVRKTPEEKTQALITGEDPERAHQIGYFRKFHSLNTYMGNLYPEDVEDFNTVELVIGWEELEAMKQFDPFEHSDEDEEIDEVDAADYAGICADIEQALKEGREVYYWPWW